MLPSRKVSWSEFRAAVRGALANPNAHFFADTSFLMKIASLNGPARTARGPAELAKITEVVSMET
jgi:hypothetical protein